jgi:hypothetical protein
MRFKVLFHVDTELEKEFETLEQAKEYVLKIDSEYVLVNDDEQSQNGYRCRYLWGGYPEGISAFIIEQ